MKRSRQFALLIISSVLLGALASCHRTPRNRLNETHFPAVVLWAWERPEDLRSIDTQRFAVAFLAQTLVLKGDDVTLNPRHQPLEVSPETKLMAVTRIESSKTTGQRPALSDAQRSKLVSLVLRTSQLNRVGAIQIDFDAASSEREFYRRFLQDLRQQLPDSIPLSITALASFCIGDRWLDDLPVDEAVPMIFRMGADDRVVRNMLAGGEDFREPLCQRSYGIATDEPVDLKFKSSRRIYVFNSRSWQTTDVNALNERIRQ
jgi:hypothetical protein